MVVLTLLSDRLASGGAVHYFHAAVEKSGLAITTRTHGGPTEIRILDDYADDVLEIAWRERDAWAKAIGQAAWAKAHPSAYSDMAAP